MILIIISFLAGILSVLAPCVLPVIPVIFSSTLGSENRLQMWRIIGSMMVSIVAFTFLLKVSSIFLNIDPHVWTNISAGIIIAYGLVLIFPSSREWISHKLRLDNTNKLADKAGQYDGWLGDMLLGASLGPIFSTCSPTYALLFSTVLPVSLGFGLLCMIVYALGFGLFLALLVIGGRKLIKRFYGVASNDGWFKKILGLILIITGSIIFTGYIKTIEIKFLDYVPDLSKVEHYLIKNTNVVDTVGKAKTAEKAENGEMGEDAEIAKLLNANYPAPDLVGLTGWINNSGYQSISQLKGKVVIIDFWTYSCINCIRTLPYIQKRHEKYAQDGLVILGIHAPEFAFEKILNNLKKAVDGFGLTYPIAQDNEMQTWSNYQNHYRPAKYIIDREGNVRYTHFGEGDYEETEEVIQYLLGKKTPKGEQKRTEANKTKNDVNDFGYRTPETYLGTARRGDNTHWSTEGKWADEEERIVLESATGAISIDFTAKQINLVIDSVDSEPVNVQVMEGGKLINSFVVDSAKLYNIAEYSSNGNHSIQIIIHSPGTSAFAFTFG